MDKERILEGESDIIPHIFWVGELHADWGRMYMPMHCDATSITTTTTTTRLLVQICTFLSFVFFFGVIWSDKPFGLDNGSEQQQLQQPPLPNWHLQKKRGSCKVYIYKSCFLKELLLAGWLAGQKWGDAGGSNWSTTLVGGSYISYHKSKSAIQRDRKKHTARMNQQPPTHHPLQACYDSAMDEPQLHCYRVSPR